MNERKNRSAYLAFVSWLSRLSCRAGLGVEPTIRLPRATDLIADAS